MAAKYQRDRRRFTAEVDALAAHSSSDGSNSDDDVQNDGHIENYQNEDNNAGQVGQQPDSHSDAANSDLESSTLSHNEVSSSSSNSELETTSESDNFDFDSDDSDIEENNLSGDLSAWATKNRLTRSSVNELLGILRQRDIDLPKDARTLLKTPRHVQHIEEKCGGAY